MKRKLVVGDCSSGWEERADGCSYEERTEVADDSTTKDVMVRCSPKRYARTCHGLKDECKNVVKEMGFGKLLEISGVNISAANWFLWMVENINVEDRTLSICGKTFILTSELFAAVIGVSDGGEDLEQGTKRGKINLSLGQLGKDLKASAVSDDMLIGPLSGPY